MAGTFELACGLDRAKTMSVQNSTGDLTTGQVITVGDTIGFALTTTAAATSNTLESDYYTFVYKAEQVDANKDGATIDQGKLVYWTGTAISESSTGNDLVGVCLEAATAAETTVLIEFDGTLTNLD